MIKALILCFLFFPISLSTSSPPPMNFDTSFDLLMIHEGGYSNHRADPGGETMLGITKSVAAANGYTGDMAKLPVEVAKKIYKDQYWDKVKADELPEALKFHVFDAAVNSGTTQAIKLLQRAVGAVDDGLLGPATLKAAKAVEGSVAAARYTGERLKFMTSLKVWPVFSVGWSRRLALNLQYTS